MKKLAILILTTFFANYSFAENTPTATTTTGDATRTVNSFTIPAPTPSGTAAVEVNDPADALYINQNLKIIPTTGHEEDQQLHYTINVSFPQISGANLPASAQQFNHIVLSMVAKSVQQFKNYVKSDVPHMQTLPESVRHNSLNVDYDIDVVKPAKHSLISVRISIEGMQAGRAHPYHLHQVLNYDLDQGKVLTLNDLFKSRADYLNVFAKYSSNDLNKALHDKFMIAGGTAPNVKNYSLWNLEPEGVLITFDEYQVAPYVAGVQEVEIPYDHLKNIISPKASIVPCVNNSDSCKV